MHLVLDFDGTITKEDTISTLANSALEFQRVHRDKDLKSKWDTAVRQYLDDLKSHEEKYPVRAEDRLTPAQEMEFMDSSIRVEQRSLERVGNSGIFEELDFDTLFQMGAEALRMGRIVLRDGFNDLCRLSGDYRFTVISVNWSRAFIMGVLREAGASGIFVIANEINHAGKIEGPESLGRLLTDASGKLEILEKVVFGDPKCMYFGDSTTDTACLIHRDGIVIRNNDDPSALISMLDRLSIAPPHVSSSGTLPRSKKELYWARDFREVLDSGVIAKAMGS